MPIIGQLKRNNDSLQVGSKSYCASGEIELTTNLLYLMFNFRLHPEE